MNYEYTARTALSQAGVNPADPGRVAGTGACDETNSLDACTFKEDCFF
jgi:hypothetical protein